MIFPVTLGTLSMNGWFWFALVVLLAWGVVGIFQKLATNHVSAESTLFWTNIGYLFFAPLIYSSERLSRYSQRGIVYGLLTGFLLSLGAWALYAALRHGGRASVVVPLVSLYPVIVVILAPLVFGESLTFLQMAGVVSALIAVALLSS